MKSLSCKTVALKLSDIAKVTGGFIGGVLFTLFSPRACNIIQQLQQTGTVAVVEKTVEQPDIEAPSASINTGETAENSAQNDNSASMPVEIKPEARETGNPASKAPVTAQSVGRIDPIADAQAKLARDYRTALRNTSNYSSLQENRDYAALYLSYIKNKDSLAEYISVYTVQNPHTTAEQALAELEKNIQTLIGNTSRGQLYTER
ncbi:MAG: hypothetical protein LBD99_03725 [Candidatus Margulisbacteria bacterium]|jgi:hypothetical protein|nr:hypothetical protein [Candidatus Margulisiibacteriota bacterium]